MWYAEAIDATAVYVIDTTAVVDIMEDVAEPIVCVEGAMEQAHKCFSLGKKRGGGATPYQTFHFLYSWLMYYFACMNYISYSWVAVLLVGVVAAVVFRTHNV